MQTEKSTPVSFKRQIAITVVTNVATVLILSSLATAIIVSTWLRTSLLSYVDHTVTELASRSVLVYLTQSETALTNAVSAIRAIPTVQSIFFLDKELRPLVRGEKVPESVKSADPKTFSEVFHWEDANSIDFIAPVRSQPPASPLGPASHTYETKPEHLGYLYVALDKSGLSTVTSTIYGVNVLIALVLGTAIILWLNRRVRNLTAPLMQLAEVMSQTAEGETGVRAQVTGPTETREIATVFNQMIEKLEHHKEFLESEVAIRTSELREARDAALSAGRLKSEFLATLTHEIRTPVAAINGYTELTIEELRFIDNSDVAIARLHEVLATSQELLEVFDRLLTFAKAEAGRAEVTVAPVDLEQLIGRSNPRCRRTP